MSRLLLALSLFICTSVFSQDSTRPLQQDTASAEHHLTKEQKEEIDRMTNRSVEFFTTYQKQQKEKQKKKAMLYIGMGVFFLVVLVVGLRRRAKK
jgi:hypothetical protein